VADGALFLDAFFSRAFLQHLVASLLPAFGPFLLALALAIVLTAVAMPVARRLGFVRVPGGRHIHLQPTPMLGGWALYLAFAAAVAWYLGVKDWRVVGMLTLCGLATLIFTYDDRFQMPASVKLAIQVALGLVAVFGFGLNITFFTLFGGHTVQLGLLSYPLTLLWLVGMQNTINLLDGVDGLAAGVVAVVAAILAAAAVSKGNDESVVMLSAALGGACLGFIVFNFHPARIFMGDSGSHFLGLALGLLSIIGVAKVAVGFALAVPLIALAIPIVDTGWAIVRRRRARLSIAHADSRHIHHQLLDFGLSQPQTCLLFYGSTAVLGAVGLMLLGHQRIWAVIVVVILVGISTVAGERLQEVTRRLPVPGFRRLLPEPRAE
jgi:UDP-GlcNAc:undecaprenyl-phosphate/decaprenyl-phosphate GlcNAc-1-phosphate transferase